jgi:translation initiation factor IF-3
VIKQIADPSQIKAMQVRLVMPDGVVVIDKAEAFRRSVEEELDLVLVQDGVIPVVKMCDVHKIAYEKQKGNPAGKSKKVKHVQIGPHTAEHDLSRLATQASGFISDGHPVVLQMEVKGRDRMFSSDLKSHVEKFASRIVGAKPGKISFSNSGATATYTMNLT